MRVRPFGWRAKTSHGTFYHGNDNALWERVPTIEDLCAKIQYPWHEGLHHMLLISLPLAFAVVVIVAFMVIVIVMVVGIIIFIVLVSIMINMIIIININCCYNADLL